MEFYQQVQNRTAQTVAVITKYAPTLKIEKPGAAAASLKWCLRCANLSPTTALPHL